MAHNETTGRGGNCDRLGGEPASPTDLPGHLDSGTAKPTPGLAPEPLVFDPSLMQEARLTLLVPSHSSQAHPRSGGTARDSCFSGSDEEPPGKAVSSVETHCCPS